jgi:RluA family pseudouridine synthase
VLNKPAGLLVSPDPLFPDRPDASRLLHAGIAEGKPWAKERGLTFLRLAHRVDAETSGIALFARSKETLILLREMFGVEQSILTYLALVRGELPDAELEVDARMGPNAARPGVAKIDSHHGKRSRTLVKVEERFTGYTLVACQPLTDRHHQIRVHLRHAGFPVVGDQAYGGKQLWLSRLKPVYRLKAEKLERALISRPALHCRQLDMPHPHTAAPVSVAAPWPKDMEVGVKYLRRYAPAAA